LAIVALVCCTKTIKFPFDHSLPKIAVESEANQSIKRYGFSCTCDFQKIGEIGNFWRNLTSQGGSSSDITAKRLGGATILTLNEQQFSVWFTTSQSIKQLHMLEVLRWAWPTSLPWRCSTWLRL